MRFVTSSILGSVVGISHLAISFFVICVLLRLLYSSVQTSITSARTESTSIATVLTASVIFGLVSTASMVNILAVSIAYLYNISEMRDLSASIERRLCWFAGL